ncbi:CehA/McbA family metallohydrolase, partial [Patescibacteria group bacterium]|nr:CehA/McbA family metallohydrolase [Patescibacteria group bacterium]
NNVISSKSLSSLVDVNSAILPVTVTFSIEKTRLQTVNGKVKIKGKLFTNYYQTFETDTIEIITNTDTVPKLTDYYCGDTHYHSSYTNNPTEYGGPINETKKVAKAIELDWITTTDHSFDLNDTPDKWSSFVDECNQIDEKFKCLVGEEVSCHISGTYRPFNAYSHFLGYNIGEYILGDEFEDGLGLNNILCRNINDHVEYMGGFGYVAHPMHGDGDPFRHTWKDFSLNYTGLQIWNGVPPYHDEILSGLRMWQSLLSEHLSSGRRVFVEGGNDAHGDFNSRFGKVRTCCYMEDFTKDNVFDALKNGRCYMTDGPALSFKVNDALIGEMLTVNTGEAVNLSFTWKSTPEFGFIEKIFIYKGAAGVDEEVVWKVNASLETPDAPKTMMYSGEVEEWLQMFEPAYFRMEARTSSGHIAYTNPIWVNVSASGNLELEKIKVTYEESASSSGEGGSVDGNFNHGEHTTFDVYVKNTGPVDAVNAKASISASGDCLLIHDTRVKSLGAVSPGSTAIAYDFYLRLDEDSGNCNALKDGKINLNVTLRHGNNGVIEKTIPVTLYVNPNDGPEFEETTSSGSQESDELYVIEADMIGEDVFGSQELYAFYRCGSTDISRNAYDGFVKMRRTCQDACGSQHEFQGKLAGIAEKCEGKRLYYRIKFEGDGRGWWSPIEAYDGGLILDDDSAPPQINVASSSGPIKPGEFYEFAADLTDAKGVLDSEYYPLAYYSWGENLVDAGNFDGVVKLSGDGTLYTGLLNVSEVYEGDTLYYRIYAGDGDNTPKYGWSQTQTGPTVHMKPPT